MTRFFLGLLASSALALSASAQVKAPVEPLVPATPAATAASAPCAPSCAPVADCPRFYGGAEWLYWTVQGNPLPALVTTSPPGTPFNTAGVLGQPTTAIIAGGTRANNDYRNGIRGRLGYWFDGCQKTGLEVSYFFLEDSREGSSFISNTTPIIGRPVTVQGIAAAVPIAYPGLSTGGTAVTSANEFEGGSALIRRNISLNECRWVDVFAGYQYLNLADELSIVSQSNVNQRVAPQAAQHEAGHTAPNQVFPAAQNAIFQAASLDAFNTRNIFHGGVVGVAAGRKYGKLTVEGRASVALGNLNRTTQIFGGSAFLNNTGGQPVFAPGGVYALPSNIGTYEDDVLAVVPEFSFRAAWQASECVRVTLGYNWLMMNNTLRAGDQISQNIGNGQPVFPNRDTTTYVHGVSAGLEFRY